LRFFFPLLSCLAFGVILFQWIAIETFLFLQGHHIKVGFSVFLIFCCSVVMVFVLHVAIGARSKGFGSFFCFFQLYDLVSLLITSTFSS